MNGIVNVNKPLGITSHDVVYRLRRILNINPKCKVTKIYDKLSIDNIDKLFKYSFKTISGVIPTYPLYLIRNIIS